MYALYWIVCTPVYVSYNVERDVTVTVVWLPAGDVYGYYPLGLFLDTTDARQASTSANGQDNLCYCPDNPGGYFVGVFRANRPLFREVSYWISALQFPTFVHSTKSPENSLSLAPSTGHLYTTLSTSLT